MAGRRRGELRVALTSDTRKYKQAMREAEDSNKRFSSRSRDAVRKLALGFAAMQVAVTAASAAMARAFIGTARELRSLTQISGASAEALQLWGKIAERSGGSAEDVADSYREMQLRLAEAAKLGTGPAVDALQLLGLTISDFAGLSEDESFDLIIRHLRGIEDQAEQLFLAEELLGGSAERLAYLWRDGGGAADEYAERLKEIGFVLSAETIQATNEFADSVDELKLRIIGLAFQAFGRLAPALTGAIRKLEQAAQAIGAWWDDTVRPLLERAATFIQTTFAPAWDAVTSALGHLRDLVTGAFKSAWETTLLPALQGVHAWVSGTLIPFLDTTWKNALAVISNFIDDTLKPAWETTLLPAITGVHSWLKDTFVPYLRDTVTGAMQMVVDKIDDNLAPAFATLKQAADGLFDLAVEEAEKLRNRADEVIDRFKVAIPDAIDNFLVPAFQRFQEATVLLSPTWLRLLLLAADLYERYKEDLAPSIDRVREKLGFLWGEIDVFVVPAFERAIELAEDLWEWLKNDLIPALGDARDYFSDLATGGMKEFNDAVPATVEKVENLTAAFDGLSAAIGDPESAGAGSGPSVNDNFARTIAFVNNHFIPFWQTVFDFFIGVVIPVLAAVGRAIFDHLMGPWRRFEESLNAFGYDVLLPSIGLVMDAIRGTLESFIGFFTGDWERALAGWDLSWRSTWNLLVLWFKDPLNRLLQALEDFSNGMIVGINGVIAAWNRLSINTPALEVAGRTIVPAVRWSTPNLSLVPRVSLPRIAALADGGIVSSATLAVIGESGPEAVVPLDRGNRRGMLGGRPGLTVNFNAPVFAGDPTEAARTIVDYIDEYSRTNGSPLPRWA